MDDLNKSKKAIRINQKLGFWLVILVFIIIIGINKHHTVSQLSDASLKKAVPVVLAAATRCDVPVYVTALGNVTPTDSVTVKTQINGQLLRVAFKEGQMVKAGDLLAEIDSRPYQAQLVQYEGQLMRDRALLANAKIDLKRYQKLWKQDSVSQQTLATQVSLVQQYEGNVKNDEGLIQSVKVNLIYCRIMAPINGRVGLRLVDQGNVVQTSDTTGIAVVNTLDPITVIFTIPEDNVPQVLPLLYANKAIEVKAYDRQQNFLLAKGTLLTMDNQIDTSTGTVKLKARFTNANHRLFPNQFVNIQLLIKTLSHATVVPTAAIQHGADGDFVYVLKEDHTVDRQPIIASTTTTSDTAITSGLLPGQWVVVDGADKLTVGTEVIDTHLTVPSKQVASLWTGFLRRLIK